MTKSIGVAFAAAAVTLCLVPNQASAAIVGFLARVVLSRLAVSATWAGAVFRWPAIPGLLGLTPGNSWPTA
jgi:hypothetical protein